MPIVREKREREKEREREREEGLFRSFLVLPNSAVQPAQPAHSLTTITE
jgi:hypothetical protein